MTDAKRQADLTVALGVEYDGGEFHGFQRQSHASSVQEALESAVSKVADEPVKIVAAGRTDAGVHATQQVISFRTSATRPTDAWRRGVSSLTPRSVGVLWAKTLSKPFHARFDAIWRRYVYVFSDAPEPPVIQRGLVVWSRSPLDSDAMHRATQGLLGERDFSSFRAAGCQSRSPWRRVLAISVARTSGYVALDVTANAFLLHMVRNIAGALRAVGDGTLTNEAFIELLDARDRTLAPPTAAPQGLYLVGVGYPGLDVAVRPPPMLL